MTLKQALKKYHGKACLLFYKDDNGTHYLSWEKSELLNARVIGCEIVKTTSADMFTSSLLAPFTACEDVYIELDREEVYKRFPNKRPIERPRKPLYKIFGKAN